MTRPITTDHGVINGVAISDDGEALYQAVHKLVDTFWAEHGYAGNDSLQTLMALTRIMGESIGSMPDAELRDKFTVRWGEILRELVAFYATVVTPGELLEDEKDLRPVRN
ncbi:hypothetical protein [Hyphomicrobium sp.]|uniref:hypothetical protein n=1 Tax=Hyphomicrobium sp. TaxID=82 RepID=UPI001D9B8E9B|nr:hypothetical protein [Hyphomicrobium sp.]MBY0562466.1 hypothetical protein [Hyphomicrobium sp.]